MKHKISVYADINCPFCFVLHERLCELNLIEKVNWFAIEHAPAADASTDDPKLSEQLNSEYKLVLKRAPETSIHNPMFIPNTKLINQVLLRVSIKEPAKSVTFRQRVYRALWQKGLDISAQSVIKTLLNEHQLAHISTELKNEPQLTYWQEMWLNGDFDLRIPALVNHHNDVLLGLQNPLTLQSFVNHKLIEHAEKYNYCQFKSKDNIAILAAPTTKTIIHTLLNNEAIELLFFDKISHLKRTLENKPIELLLIDAVIDPLFSLCRNLNFEKLVDIPIIYFTESDATSESESKALSMGASDIIDLTRQSDSLYERLKVHLRYKKKLDILTSHASHDCLTGLYNRREVDDFLQRSWRNACRHQKNIAVLMIDIDHFKDYNDHYGHPSGDEALLIVANALSSGRSEDLVGRIGGEEFIIIINDEPQSCLNKIASRIHNELSAQKVPHQKSKTNDYLTISIGIGSTIAHADNNYRMLLEVADQALYKAKSNGRNRTEANVLAAPKYD